MSNLTAVFLIVALSIPAVLIYLVMDRMVIDRADAVTTGIVRGVSVSMEHRWFLLNITWATTVGVMVAYQIIISIGWMLIGKNLATEEAGLYAYLIAFFGFCSVLAWVPGGLLWYLRLRSELRQAEAD
jgi:hypothetical protein